MVPLCFWTTFDSEEKAAKTGQAELAVSEFCDATIKQSFSHMEPFQPWAKGLEWARASLLPALPFTFLHLPIAKLGFIYNLANLAPRPWHRHHKARSLLSPAPPSPLQHSNMALGQQQPQRRERKEKKTFPAPQLTKEARSDQSQASWPRHWPRARTQAAGGVL